MSVGFFWQNPVFRHLRFSFSWFLLPPFMMGWLMVPNSEPERVWQLAFVLHLLVYPSSNAYNSSQDHDEGSIGGMEHPPKAPKSLRWWCLGLDFLALAISTFWWIPLGIGIGAYILASRAYSWRPLRLKKFPFLGFFTVAFFQGPWVILLCAAFLPRQPFGWEQLATPGLWYIASLLVLAGSYPLTQVYQHTADKADGVLSISALLGVQGTFRFSAATFSVAGPFLLLPLWLEGRNSALLFLALALIPTLCFFLSWWKKVRCDETAANFKNTMTMNLVASSSLNLVLLLIGGVGL